MTQSVSSVVFDTEALPPEHREEAWRAVLSAQNIELPPGETRARLLSTRLDRMDVRRIWATPLGTDRTADVIRRDGFEHLTLHLTGAPVLAEVRGESVTVAPGVVTISDAAQPLRRRPSSEHGTPVISLARDLVEEALPAPERLHALRLSGPANALLAGHLQALADWAPEAREADAAGLARATALVLAAAVGPTLSTLGAVRPALEAARLSRGRRYIRDHLSDPQLGPDALAEALHLSRSVVYRLFEPLGGVASYVRDQRLALAWRRLQAPTGREGIAQVAADCGFTSATHFTRLFKAAYGVTPKEARQAAPPGPDAALLLRREVLKVWSDGLG